MFIEYLICLAIAWLIINALTIPPAMEFAGLPSGVGDFLPNDDEKPWERFLLFKKGGGSAPSPDPNIGRAAMKQAELGDDWLKFAEQQFAEASERQVGIDELSGKLTKAQTEAMEQSTEWAKEDREIQKEYRDKYDQWADEDRQTGKDYRDDFAQMGQDAVQEGQRYQGRFDQQAQQQYDFATEQQDRYRDTFQPMEDRFAKDAEGWDSPERQAQMAAEARADVLSSSKLQQDAQNRQMAAMGIDPRSGRHAGVDNAAGIHTALAAAGAQNQARDGVRQQGMALRGTAIDMGRGAQAMGQQAAQMGQQASAMGHSAGTQGTSTAMQAHNLGLAASGIGNTAAQLGMSNQGGGYQGLGLGVNAAQGAMGTQLGAHGAFGQNSQIMGQGYQGAMQGYAGQASTLNNLYNSQLSAWTAQQQASAQSSAGIGSLIGTGLSAAAMFSSKKAKTDKRPVKGALKAVESMPVEKWKYKDGIADGGEHVGPYAEDFKRATGLGDGKSINLIDAIGLNMKATQELSDKVDRIGRKPRKRASRRRQNS